jgi:hypothetical protein
MCFQLSRKFMVLPGDGIFHEIVHKIIEVQPTLPGNNNNVADWREQSLDGFQLIGTTANPGVKQDAGPIECLYRNVLRIYDSRTKHHERFRESGRYLPSGVWHLGMAFSIPTP